MRAAAASALRRLRGVPVPLRLLLAVAALEILLWVSFAPPWQGPDENAHFAYAQHLAETGHAPSKNFPNVGAGSESTQQGTAESWFNLRSVGLPGTRPNFTSVDRSSWNAIDRKFPDANRADGYGPNSQAQNPPAFYWYEAIPYEVTGGESLLTTTFWMRLWTGLLFLLSVAFTWLAAGELFGKRRLLQTLSASAVALLPQLAYMGSIVNADVSLTAIWSAFTWLALRLLKRGPSLSTILPVAVTVGISVITHGRGLPLVAPGAVAVVLAFVRHRDFSARKVLAAAAGLAVVVVALAWAFHQTKTSGGTEFAYGGEARLVQGGSLKGFFNYVWQFYLPGLPGMNPKIGPDYGFDQVFITSFFGSFGSLEVLFPSWVYDWLHAAELIGLVALLVALWVRRRAVLRSWDVLVVLGTMVVALLFVLHFVAYRDMLGAPGDPVIVGRYVLPLVPVWALGIGVVASALPRRAAVGFAGLVVAAGVLLQFTGLGLTLTRFYA